MMASFFDTFAMVAALVAKNINAGGKMIEAPAARPPPTTLPPADRLYFLLSTISSVVDIVWTSSL
jgi:hypothetical protein